MKPIYTAPDPNAALTARTVFADSTWGKKYPATIQPDLSQLRLGSCLWIVLVLVRAFWVRRVGH